MTETLVNEAKIEFTEFNVRQDRGLPHFIRLCDGVVKRLEQDSAVRKGEAFGVLIGTVECNENCTITVENFEAAGVVEQHIRAWTPPSGSGQVIVGYYRSLSTKAGFELDEADRALFERCFPREARVALLMKPSRMGAGNATFFLGDEGKLDPEHVTVEFPFNLQQLTAEEPAPVSDPVSKPLSGKWLSKLLMTALGLMASVAGLSALGVFERKKDLPSPVEEKPALALSATPPVAVTSVPAQANPNLTDEPQPAKKTTPAAAMKKSAPPADEIVEDAKPEPSPIYTPPLAMRQFAPILPEALRRAIRGAVVVRVRVNVSANGQVIDAEPLAGDQSAAEPFALAATTAVRRWQFEPARRGTERIPSQTVLSFTFRQ